MKITEDYVSFEVAKLLKEKGFREDCIATYSLSSKQFNIEEVYQDWTSLWSSVISAPTLQMARKWLREIHKVNIIIDYDENEYCKDNERYWFTVCQNNKSKVDLATYVTYEESVEAALKYVLENLI